MLVACEQPEQWCHLEAGAVQALDGAVFQRDQADLHLCWLAADRSLAARCSLWWRNTPQLYGRRVGAIGHYAALDAAGATTLLAAACNHLQRAGCAVAIGPLDGNTWRSYRCITERNGAANFFLEPDPGQHVSDHFTATGFREIAAYRSSRCDQLQMRDPRMARVKSHLEDRGIRFRSLSSEPLEADLRAIHQVSLVAFQHAFLYQPIAVETLRRSYQPLVPQLDPSLVWFACRDDETLGFVFGIPDYSQPARGKTLDTAILKTLAVRPGRAHAGLGLVLTQMFHDAASARGLRTVIHALIHEGNSSAIALSARYTRPFRRYGLFARELL